MEKITWKSHDSTLFSQNRFLPIRCINDCEYFQSLRARLHYDVKVTSSKTDGTLVSMERRDPWLYNGSKHRGTGRLIIDVYGLIQKIKNGVATPFRGRLSENVSGGRGLSFLEKSTLRTHKMIFFFTSQYTVLIFFLPWYDICSFDMQEVIRMSRPWKCGSGAGSCWCADCCNCCSDEITVESPPGQMVAKIRHAWVCKFDKITQFGHRMKKVTVALKVSCGRNFSYHEGYYLFCFFHKYQLLLPKKCD